MASNTLADLSRIPIDQLIPWMCYVLAFLGVSSFFSLLYLSAPYGRYSRQGWGIMLNAKFAWVTQELPALLIPAYLFWRHGTSFFFDHPLSARTWLAAAFLAHYTYRTLVFPLLLRGGKQTPATVWALALFFCLYNGFMQGWHLAEQKSAQDLVGPREALGLVLWAFGLLNVIRADLTLINLRKPGETGYKIPHGGLFEYVSAANYSGEILEWSGYALAAGSLPPITFAFFTFCNLAPRGAQHHRWYRAKFEDYPKTRRAVIPFLW